MSTITGNTIDFNDSTGVGVVVGSATVVTATATLTADKITVYTNEHRGTAEGNVRVSNASGTLSGSSLDYSWDGSVGAIEGAVGESPPWRFEARRMNQIGDGLFELEDGSLTSCDLNPPHYKIRASNGRVKTGVRAKMANSRLVLDQTPSFYLPYYTRSLKPRKYTLRLEPGSSGRDGFTNRTTFGYPFSQNTFTKLRWDYLERTGNGYGLNHRYFNPNIRGDFDAYYISDTNPDPEPESKRYSLLWNHFQRITPRLTLNAKTDLKSDQTVGNQFQDVGNDVRVENQTRGLLTEAGLNYQFPRSALQFNVDRRDRFDSTVSSKNFISKLTLPNITYNTVPIKFRFIPFYTGFAATFLNETNDRSSPTQTLKYQRSASGTIQVKRDIRLKSKTTFTPIGSYQQTWKDRDVTVATSTDKKDIYQGRYTAGADVRQRIGRDTDGTLSYLYGERLETNGSEADVGANDRGVEQNRLNASAVTRVGRNTRLSLASGYDFRRAPRNDPSLYDHQAARVSPPTVDIQWEARRNVSVYFRETYGLYDPIARQNVKSPLNTSGEVQVGSIASRTFFSQGFSYTKPVSGTPSEVILNNKFRFYPSLHWHLDLYISYKATGNGGLDYRKVAPIEKTLQVARDLHCWVFRMRFSDRPGRREASFYIDLKANLHGQRDLFTAEDPDLRYNQVDVSQIFPENSQDVSVPAGPLPVPEPAEGPVQGPEPAVK